MRTEPNIKDYLPLYLGSGIMVTSHESPDRYEDIIEGMCVGESVGFKKTGDYYFDDYNEFTIQLILRKLDSMTEEEFERFEKLTMYHPRGSYRKEDMAELIMNSCEPQVLLYTLQQHFDLFGLIESGLAIDAKTIQP